MASRHTQPTDWNEVKLTTIETADGPFTLLASEGVVLASGWTAEPQQVLDRLPNPSLNAELVDPTDPDVRAPVAAVRAYYAGDHAAIDQIPVRQEGSQWRSRGWQRLREIPAGEPLSYAEFATALGNPAGVRAAAGVCAKNAAALFVPCHRVLRSDGSLGGFAWGVPVKRSLLEREARSATLL